MHLSPSLIRWYLHQSSFVTQTAACIAAAFILGYTGRLDELYFWPFALMILESVASCWAMCRFESPAAAFLHTRGFTRDRLWFHRLIAQLIGMLFVWGAASLCLWLGVRSAFQGGVLQNPMYPLLKQADFALPWLWLAIYLIIACAVGYAPVRRAQPTRDVDAGYAVLVGYLIALSSIVNAPGIAWRLVWWAALATVSVVLLVGSWRLNREVEVRP